MSESSLKSLYGSSVNDVFTVTTGVTMKAVYRPDWRVCTVTISGVDSEPELMKIFEAAVPAKIRGLKKLSLFQCAGPCQQFLKFANVDLASGVVGHQTSEPSAIVRFKRRR